MTCAEAREAILEADPPILRGEGDDALAFHLRECDECRALAHLVLAGAEGLGTFLRDAPRSPSPDEILEEAGRFRRSPFRTPLVLAPLLAAAGLAALLLLPESPTPEPASTVPATPKGLDLDVPEGRSAAVFTTGDPDITVLWIF